MLNNKKYYNFFLEILEILIVFLFYFLYIFCTVFEGFFRAGVEEETGLVCRQR